MPKKKEALMRLCPQTRQAFYDMNRSIISALITGERRGDRDRAAKSTVGVTSKAN